MRTKIENVLKELVSGIDLCSESLVDDGYIDSIVMIQLISELDIAFDIEITFASINKSNFNSVDAIMEMVNSYMKR